MKNSLALRHLPLSHLSVGESTLVGPYKSSTTAATLIAREKQRLETRVLDKEAYNAYAGEQPVFKMVKSEVEFVQSKMILTNPVSCSSHQMFLITRVK